MARGIDITGNTAAFRLEGDALILKKLDNLKLIQQADKLTLMKALRAGAKVIMDPAKATARTFHNKRGARVKRARAKSAGKKYVALYASIKSRMYGSSLFKDNAGIVIAVRKRTGHLIEFGHKTKLGQRRAKQLSLFSNAGKGKRYVRKSRGSISFVAGRPFMQPAIDSQAQAAAQRMGEVLAKYIHEKASAR